MSIVDIMLEVQRRWGRNSLQLARDMQPNTRLISGGHPVLDELLDGGLPVGKISSLIGVPTSGVTTLAYHAIAQAQRDNGEAIYIDMDTIFSGGYAQACAVNLDRLLVVQPPDVLDALTLIRQMAHSQLVRLLVMDVGQCTDLPLQRLVQSLISTQMVLLLLASQPIRHTHVRLGIQCRRWLYDRQDVVGCHLEATLLQHPHLAIGQIVNFELSFDERVGHD